MANSHQYLVKISVEQVVLDESKLAVEESVRYELAKVLGKDASVIIEVIEICKTAR